MLPLDSWVEITFKAPYILLPLFALGLIGLVIGGVRVYRQRSARIKDLAAEIQTMRAQASTSSSDEAYHHFVSNVAHGISNPLQSIQTNLDNLANCSPDEIGRWRQYHAILATEVQRLMRMTENLRLLSLLETVGASTIREPVNLKAIAEDVIMAQFEGAEARHVRLRYMGPDRPARVLGDRDQLRQVLMNLVDNGIKYAKPIGGEIIISVQDENDPLCVRVSDTGIGIAAEDLPHIFDTAYRAPDARSFQHKGSGLGLAIAKRIVEQHGGTLKAQSQLGEGTTFLFDLPLYSSNPQ